jgi:L-amino acid N-acyltransferase YncA
MDGHVLSFRHATPDDWPTIWPIVHVVVAEGITYPYPPDITQDDAKTLWMLDGSSRRVTYVAEVDGTVVGTAYLKPNQVGLGDHVANAGWMIDPRVGGQGIGRQFASHVIDEARRLGFTAMQFNAVVATNTGAIALWESMGFDIVGTVPDAFRHCTKGPTAIHIMHRSL